MLGYVNSLLKRCKKLNYLRVEVEILLILIVAAVTAFLIL